MFVKATSVLKIIAVWAMLVMLFVSANAVCAEELSYGESQASVLFSYIPDTCNDTATLSSESAIDALENGMRNFDEKIDVSRFGYFTSDLSPLNDDYSIAVNTNYDLYYVTSRFRYGYNSLGQIIYIYPIYSTTDTEEVEKTVKLMDAEIEKILSYVDDSMTDAQKLLAIHDRIVLQTQYDDTLTKYSAKDLFLDGTAVCQGYAAALHCVAEKLGITGGLVRSEQMNHMWNVFLIDGKWYHVDATWDDPASYRYAGILHKYFLKSDKWMTDSGNHYGFNSGSAVSTDFDSFFWHSLKSPVITVSGQMFFIDNSGMYGALSVYNSYTGKTEELYKFTKLWMVDSGRYWSDTFSGLAYYDGRLYFNTQDAVMSCKPDGTDVKTEYTISNAASHSVYGCFECDGKICYEVSVKTETDGDYEKYFMDITPDEIDSFYPVKTFENNGKKYLSYTNEQEKPCNVFVFTKSGGRLSEVKIIPISTKKGTVELEVASDSFEIMAVTSDGVPLMKKILK